MRKSTRCCDVLLYQNCRFKLENLANFSLDIEFALFIYNISYYVIVTSQGFQSAII